MGMNPADLNALTEAVQLKKETGGSIDVFSMGTLAARSVLGYCISDGGRMKHIWLPIVCLPVGILLARPKYWRLLYMKPINMML